VTILQRPLMTALPIAIVAIAVVNAQQPSRHDPQTHVGRSHAPQAHDSQMHDPQAHFEHVAAQLSLTAEQRDALAEPVGKILAAVQEIHRLHEAIAAALTEEQKTALRVMLHKSLPGHAGGEHHRSPQQDDGR